MLKSSSNDDVLLEKLLTCFNQLNSVAQQNLLDYATFLHSREENRVADTNQATQVPDEPLSIPRPEQETVIAAIKRLSNTYPMLDSDKLLHETAHFMTKHIIHGQEAVEVINELEDFFQQAFETHKQE